MSSVPTMSVDMTPTPVTTSPTFKEVVNIIQEPMLKLEDSLNNSSEKSETWESIAEKNDTDLYTMVQMTMSDVDSDFYEFDMIEHFHALQKWETKWKAYGFDSSMLQIADPGESRNLWFKQLTHSVRLSSHRNCPYVVRVSTPGTWPSILETVPEPLTPECQSLFKAPWVRRMAPTLHSLCSK